jgi:hypothetical protein
VLFVRRRFWKHRSRHHRRYWHLGQAREVVLEGEQAFCSTLGTARVQVWPAILTLSEDQDDILNVIVSARDAI